MAVRNDGITSADIAYNLLRMVAADDRADCLTPIIEDIYKKTMDCMPLMIKRREVLTGENKQGFIMDLEEYKLLGRMEKLVDKGVESCLAFLLSSKPVSGPKHDY